jgi:hypothetical protein
MKCSHTQTYTFYMLDRVGTIPVGFFNLETTFFDAPTEVTSLRIWKFMKLKRACVGKMVVLIIDSSIVIINPIMSD